MVHIGKTANMQFFVFKIPIEEKSKIFELWITCLLVCWLEIRTNGKPSYLVVVGV